MRIHGSFTAACALALAGCLGLGAAPASARDQTGAIVGGLAAGMVGGVIGGALVNGANQPPPPPEYRPRRVVVEEPEVVVVRERRREPICHYERRKEWLGGGEFTYRKIEVCE